MSGAAVKRLLRELKEIREVEEREGLPFQVYPLEDSFLCWHFSLHGPEETVYSEGLYHGRMDFPADYPFSPPSVYFSTPNGRFETNIKICLSVTGFHPELWQPAWGVRTMLLALREHFLVEDRGAIGYLGFSSEERRLLAQKSGRLSCSQCAYNCHRRNTADSSNGAVVSNSPLLSGTLLVVALAISWLLYYLLAD